MDSHDRSIRTWRISAMLTLSLIGSTVIVRYIFLLTLLLGVDQLTTYYIQLTMFADGILVTFSLYACFKKRLGLLLISCALAIFSLACSTPLTHPSNNPRPVVLTFAVIVIFQLAAFLFLVLFIYSLKHREYHGRHNSLTGSLGAGGSVSQSSSSENQRLISNRNLVTGHHASPTSGSPAFTSSTKYKTISTQTSISLYSPE